MEKCIGCELCAGVCPARCIYVRGAGQPDLTTRCRPASASASSTRSTTCAASTATCAWRRAPTEAITESKLFEFSFTNRPTPSTPEAELVVDDEGQPKQLPWEDWCERRPTVVPLTSAWVRATASSGSAEHDGPGARGRGELGFGVKRARGRPGRRRIPTPASERP